MGEPLEKQALHAWRWLVFIAECSLDGFQLFAVFTADHYFFRSKSMLPGVQSRTRFCCLGCMSGQKQIAANRTNDLGRPTKKSLNL